MQQCVASGTRLRNRGVGSVHASAAALRLSLLREKQGSVALALCSFPLQACAHGEGSILLFVASLATAAGLLGGILSATWKPVRQFNWPQWFIAYLLLGCIITGAATGGIDGSTLFLAFGGIGAILPFLLAFYLSRSASSWLKQRILRLVARSDA